MRSAKNLSHEEGNKKGLYDFISRNLLTVRFHRFPVRFLPCRFHYSSVPWRFGSSTFRFGLCIAGSVPLRFGFITVRFHRFPVRFRPCPFGSITVQFLLVRFAGSRFGSAAILKEHWVEWNGTGYIILLVAHIPWIIYPMRSLSNLRETFVSVRWIPIGKTLWIHSPSKGDFEQLCDLPPHPFREGARPQASKFWGPCEQCSKVLFLDDCMLCNIYIYIYYISIFVYVRGCTTQFIGDYHIIP